MATTPSRTVGARTIIVRLTIGSFSLAALMGVLALLSGGAFGETEGKVLLTTLLVGVASVLVLCYLATSGTWFQPVGVAGGIVLVAPVVAALVMIWSEWEGDPPLAVVRTFGVGAIAAGTLAQASLLLALVRDRAGKVRHLLSLTLALAGVLAGLTSALVLGFEPDTSAYPRLVGVVAILDVLGTVVVAALTRFDSTSAPHATTVTVPAGLLARLDARAAETCRTRDEVVADAVERYLATPQARR
jgi:hypothetical protein